MVKNLQFKISSGLKNIIGRELITDDFIAVFELVKNAYDARAKEVRIIYEEGKLVIRDDGKGMSYDDILNKWLFVAYSAKKAGIEDSETDELVFDDYRDKIQARRVYAGAKGIGRFSCDKIGSSLTLITRKAKAHAAFEKLEVNWDDFEEDPLKEFVEVNVRYSSPSEIDYPGFKHGTILEILLREPEWSRDKILELKHSLEKLINPLNILSQENKDKFSIIIDCVKELEDDSKEQRPRYKVNGPVANFIFETLNLKTTQIITTIDDSGSDVITELIDRGTSIYKVKEINPSKPKLKGITYHLFHLNQAAKYNFTNQMGIGAHEFGSIFIFRNGFRVYPFGEVGEDTLGIDARKAQGFWRHLGTRDLIGRIEIIDDKDAFKETSSRDGGLIKNNYYRELTAMFEELCLKRFESYVVDVNWKFKADKLQEDLSELNNVSAKTRIINIISKLVSSKDIALLSYDKDFLNIVKAKIDETTPEVYKNLAAIANKTNDAVLAKEIAKAEKKYLELRLKSEHAIEAEETARKLAEDELRQQKKENLFLKSITTVEKKEIISLQHHIDRGTDRINRNIDNLTAAINSGEPKSVLLNYLNKISFENRKISTIARFVTKANFNLMSSTITKDLVRFIREYVENVYKEYKHLIINKQQVDVKLEGPEKFKFDYTFRPLEIIIIIDNLLNNSYKAHAKKVVVSLVPKGNNKIIITFSDDGKGIPGTNIDKVFDFGFTTTDGSGIGLYHVKQIVDKMKGTIETNSERKKGAEFIITLNK